MQKMEWIFTGIHWIGVPVALATGFFHDPSSSTTMGIFAAILAVWNTIAAMVNFRINSIRSQLWLGIASQAVIAIFVWGVIFQFVSNEQTAAYGAFIIVIIESAVRFSFAGSLVMGIVAAVGQTIAMLYRDWEYDISFDLSGYLVWISLFVVIAVSVGLATEETRRVRHRNEQLAKERSKLEERHSIAHDMYDKVLRTLQGLALEAYALKKQSDSPVISDKIEYIRETCQRSSQEMKDIIYELRNEDENEGVASQMSRIVDAWSKATGIETEFKTAGVDLNLPPITSYNLRSVLSEALINIFKHAEASRVDVSVELSSGEICLEIHDNGKGMALSEEDLYRGASKGTYGILGMKEHVEQLNGQFSIDGATGTRLIVTVPLSHV